MKAKIGSKPKSDKEIKARLAYEERKKSNRGTTHEKYAEEQGKQNVQVRKKSAIKLS